MKPRPNYRLPEEKQEKLRKVVRLEWTTIFFLLTITVVRYLSMGGSQALYIGLNHPDRFAWIISMTASGDSVPSS